MKLHAHLEYQTRDCDGPQEYGHIARPTAEENADEFGDLDFKRRVFADAVSVVAEEAMLTVTKRGGEWHENTEEGYRHIEIHWCELERCGGGGY